MFKKSTSKTPGTPAVDREAHVSLLRDHAAQRWHIYMALHSEMELLKSRMDAAYKAWTGVELEWMTALRKAQDEAKANGMDEGRRTLDIANTTDAL